MLRVTFLSAAIAFAASTGIVPRLASAPSSRNWTFPLTIAPAPPADGSRHGDAPRSFARADDGLFYVTARVDGTPVRFIVDTGSNVVVLTARDAARIGKATKANSGLAVQTAGGLSHMHEQRIRRITLAGQSIDDVDTVFVDRNLQVSLLGQSALSRLRSVRFAGDTLALN